jgi:hypothetical protein
MALFISQELCFSCRHLEVCRRPYTPPHVGVFSDSTLVSFRDIRFSCRSSDLASEPNPTLDTAVETSDPRSGAKRSNPYFQIPRTSMGSLSPLKLPAHLTCGIRLKTPSRSVFSINSRHSFVAIHSSRACLLRNLTSSIVSWLTSLGIFDRLPGGCGISTGNVSNCVTSGEKAAWTPTLERSLSRG